MRFFIVFYILLEKIILKNIKTLKRVVIRFILDRQQSYEICDKIKKYKIGTNFYKNLKSF